MKTSLQLFITLFAFGIIFYSCKKDVVDSTADCDSPDARNVEAFFNTLNNQPGYFLYESMDLLTHEYTFSTTDDLQICGFAYKSQDPNAQYQIELVDSNGNPVFSQQMSFSNTAFEFIGVPPFTITAGTYTLKRTIGSGNGFTIGPITRAGTQANPANPTFPINLGSEITIQGSNFYGAGGPVPNYGIPNIYFEYVKL